MAIKEEEISEELLNLQAAVELTLQRIEKLRSKLNGKPSKRKKPLSAEHVAQVISKRHKTRLRK